MVNAHCFLDETLHPHSYPHLFSTMLSVCLHVALTCQVFSILIRQSVQRCVVRPLTPSALTWRCLLCDLRVWRAVVSSVFQPMGGISRSFSPLYLREWKVGMPFWKSLFLLSFFQLLRRSADRTLLSGRSLQPDNLFNERSTTSVIYSFPTNAVFLKLTYLVCYSVCHIPTGTVTGCWWRPVRTGTLVSVLSLKSMYLWPLTSAVLTTTYLCCLFLAGFALRIWLKIQNVFFLTFWYFVSLMVLPILTFLFMYLWHLHNESWNFE